MKKTLLVISALIVSLILSSCATTKKSEIYANFYDQKPEVFLIMPPINNSNNVEAKDCFYTTVSMPIAEAGYYVLPPASTYATLQRESAYDAERFLEGDLKKFNSLFGADIAVFTVIKRWEKSVIGSSIEIEIQYIFRSTKTNETLFTRDATIVCDTSTGVSTSGSLLASLIVATANAVKTAVTDYVDIASRCNFAALQDLPAGKYSPKYNLDTEEAALAPVIRLSTSK